MPHRIPSTDDLLKLLSDNGLSTLLANMNGGSLTPTGTTGQAAPETSGLVATISGLPLVGGSLGGVLTGNPDVGGPLGGLLGGGGGPDKGDPHSGTPDLGGLDGLLHFLTSILTSLLGGAGIGVKAAGQAAGQAAGH